MQETNLSRCIECMDYSCDWSIWRQNLRKNITGEKHFYWQDEAIQNIAERLNALLDNKVSAKTQENDLITEMWDVATPDERKSLAMVLLKLAQKSE